MFAMKNYFVKITCLVILGLLFFSCVKQRKITVTQTFVLSNRTEYVWDMKLYVCWDGKNWMDSAEIHVDKTQTDSVVLDFVLREKEAVGPLWMPTSNAENYYHWGCFIKTKLINKTTQQIYEWEQQLFPNSYVMDNYIKEYNVNPYYWEFVSSSGSAVNQKDVFRCIIDPY